MAKDTDNLARGERLQIMLSPDELNAVDDFRFRHRMPSRAAAVRELFRIGLTSIEAVQSGDGRKSSDIGAMQDGGSVSRPGFRGHNDDSEH